jgi:hypothetical protein
MLDTGCWILDAGCWMLDAGVTDQGRIPIYQFALKKDAGNLFLQKANTNFNGPVRT